MVAREREHMPEGSRQPCAIPAAFPDALASAAAADGGVRKIPVRRPPIWPAAARNRDGVAVQAQRHRRDRIDLHMPKPQAGRDSGGRQHVRGIEIAEIELVPDIGPGHLPDEFEMQAFVFGEAEFRRCHQQQRRRRAG